MPPVAANTEPATNDLPQQPSSEQEETREKKPAYHHRRTGFVAQKPKPVRDKINHMLLDGVPYKKIVANLADDGKDLNEDHIRNWAAGGYLDWLATLDRKEALWATREAAIDLLDEKAGTPAQDASRTVAATQLYELLLSFDPRTFATQLTEKPELYLRLINALSRLCEGEAVCAHRRVQQSILETNLQSGAPADEKKLLSPEELKELARQIKLIK